MVSNQLLGNREKLRHKRAYMEKSLLSVICHTPNMIVNRLQNTSPRIFLHEKAEILPSSKQPALWQWKNYILSIVSLYTIMASSFRWNKITEMTNSFVFREGNYSLLSRPQPQTGVTISVRRFRRMKNKTEVATLNVKFFSFGSITHTHNWSLSLRWSADVQQNGG